MENSRATSESSDARYLPAPGDVIAGKYVVQKIVGKGGMGVVVAAKHLALKQTVAIKLLSARDSTHPDAVRRLLREAELAAALRSDHVVRVHDVGMLEDGSPFLVMEFLVGKDASQILDQRGPLPVAEAVEWVMQTCDAVAEAHASGIVHRDLKPSNLFVITRRDGRAMVKVLDFGISKLLPKDASLAGSLTATRSVLGSPYYMSPEQVRDSRQVDGRCDIWALGVILHELLTGQPAFVGETLPSVCAAIVADDPASIRAKRPDVPEELARIVSRCLEKDPQNRYQSAETLLDALRPFGPLERSSLAPEVAIRSSTSIPVSSTDRRVQVRRPRVAEIDNAATQVSGSNLTPVATSRPPKTGSGNWPVKGGVAAILVATSALVALVYRGSLRTDPEEAVNPLGSPLQASVTSSGSGRATLSPRLPNKPPFFSGKGSSTGSRPAPRALAVGTSFALKIDSNPSNAQVFQGRELLGATPFEIQLDRRAVAAGPIEFRLLREGYEPFIIRQGGADKDVWLVVELVPLGGDAGLAGGDDTVYRMGPADPSRNPAHRERPPPKKLPPRPSASPEATVPDIWLRR